ncbi:MAG TPA: hypothetical protein VGI39_35935 [Polyangiaceae bacterium]|jgi:hypothetical protein
MPGARFRTGARRGVHVAPPLLALAASIFSLGGCYGFAAPTLAPDAGADDASSPSGGGGLIVPEAAAPPPIAFPPTSEDASPPPEAASPTPAPGPGDAAADAPPEASSPSPAAIRCGGPPQPTFCTGTSSCCATQLNSGFDYTCNPGSCSGISILCADRADCGPGQVCCFGTSDQFCTAAPACPIGHEACDPGAATPCVLGGVCQQLVFNGFLVPYFGCE